MVAGGAGLVLVVTIIIVVVITRRNKKMKRDLDRMTNLNDIRKKEIRDLKHAAEDGEYDTVSFHGDYYDRIPQYENDEVEN